MATWPQELNASHSLSASHYSAFIADQFGVSDTITTLSLQPISLDSSTILHGVLFVPLQGIDRELGSADVYLNNVLIESQAKVLPQIGSFFLGLLHLTTSVQFSDARRFLNGRRASLRSELFLIIERWIESTDSSVWSQIGSNWQTQFKWAALSDSKLRFAAAPFLTFESNDGKVTYDELNTKNTINFSKIVNPGHAWFKSAFAAMGRVLFTPSYEDQKLIEQMVSTNGATAERIDSTAKIQDVDINEYPDFAKLLVGQSIAPIVGRVTLARLESKEVPALLMPDKDAQESVDDELVNQLEQSLRIATDDNESFEIMHSIRRQISNSMHTMNLEGLTLVLNVENPLVELLASLAEDSIGIKVGLRELLHTTYMISTSEYDEKMIIASWKGTCDLVEKLQKLQARTNELEGDVLRLSNSVRTLQGRLNHRASDYATLLRQKKDLEKELRQTKEKREATELELMQKERMTPFHKSSADAYDIERPVDRLAFD